MCGKLTIFVILLVTYNCVVGWIAVIEPDPSTVIPEGAHCYTTFKNIGSLKLKEIRRVSEECAQAKCSEDKRIHVTGCAPVVASPPCYIYPGNLSKPFPDCCYEVKCLEDPKKHSGENQIEDSSK